MTTTIEDQKRLIDQAAKWHGTSNRERMKLALIAAHLAGKYEEGAIIELAHRLYMSVSQVYNYARSGKLFTEMVAAARAEDRELSDEGLSRATGRSEKRAKLYEAITDFVTKLGITYWYTIDRLRQKYNSDGHFTVALVWSYLADVLEYDGTLDRLKTLIDTEFGHVPQTSESIKDTGAEVDRDEDDEREPKQKDIPAARPLIHIYTGKVVIVDKTQSGKGSQITVEIDGAGEIILGSMVQVTITDPVALQDAEADQ